jgi:putative membrane-bound dehydrogenase-like protein
MRDYPSGMRGGLEPGGHVVVLADEDGDGRYRRASVFLDDLPFPTGILLWRDGVLVCAAPDVLFARDTDGDGRADEVRALLTGFATHNYQARVNSLELGLDGWVHGASGLFGGQVSSSSGKRVDLGGRDFRFRPDTGALEAVTGISQQGRMRNDWGDWFGCDSGTLVRQYPLDAAALVQNPYAAPPPMHADVTRDADANRLFPRARILERFNELGTEGRTTSACGLCVYRDDWLGDELQGDVFTCEPVHQLVHRTELLAGASVWTGRRASDEAAREFLASEDVWFRPVQARTGPDGALWVVDMYRFLIEHPQWVSAERMAGIDARAGSELGRIWRVVPRARGRRAVPRLDRASLRGLIDALDSDNGVVRDWAQRLLLERSPEGIGGRLRSIAGHSTRAAARAQALALLADRGELAPDDLARALCDGSSGVRRLALARIPALCESDARVDAAVLLLAEDADPMVRLAAAQALGRVGQGSSRAAARAIARLDARDGADPFVAAALRSVLLAHATALARGLGASELELSTELAAELARSAASGGQVEALDEILAHATRLLGTAELERGLVLVAAARKGLAAAGIAREFSGLAERALELVQDPALVDGVRRAALAILAEDGALTSAEREAALAIALRPPSLALRAAALETLGCAEDPAVPEALLAGWSEATPGARAAFLDLLLVRESWARAALEAARERPEVRAVFDAARRRAVLEGFVRLAPLASEVFAPSAAAPRRAEVVARYGALERLRAEPARGRAVFERACASCHALEGLGRAIGPDLAALSDRSDAALLGAVLDPNRALQAGYANYYARLSDGRTLSGLLVRESETGIVLLGTDGQERALRRAEIEELYDTRLSLMPEGLEGELPPSDMADLFAYLRSVDQPPKRFAGNAPALVLPDEQGVIACRAAQARILGSSLVFEQPFQNLGYWSSSDDRAEWDVDVPADGDYEVELEWACDDGVAGNTFVLCAPGERLSGVVGGTGGWPHYRTRSIGELSLRAGRQRLVVQGDGPIRGALLDLRSLRLVPRRP